MKRKVFPTLVLLALSFAITASSQEKKYSRESLQQDLSALYYQVTTVHADPFTEKTKKDFALVFDNIRMKLRDSMTEPEFYAVIKPVMAYLADEHADIAMPSALKSGSAFLPFTLEKIDKGFIAADVLTPSAINKGDEIIAIDGHPVMEILNELAGFSNGASDERKEKALGQFGYLYGMAHPNDSFHLVTIKNGLKHEVRNIGLSQWNSFLRSKYGGVVSGPRISFRLEKTTGYITCNSFSARGNQDLNNYSLEIDSIFMLIERYKPLNLVIDVSNNSGGNSSVGDLLIRHFHSKPYFGYGMNWRRSNEYLQVLKSYGDKDEAYEALSPGDVLHYGGDTIESSGNTIFPGKVYIVVGNGTFSSAMMFATIIKDNHLATLIGVTPKLGHPSHFGELYSYKLPNTGLAIRFGVKEWIRPAGKNIPNILIPDIILPDTEPATVLRAVQAN